MDETPLPTALAEAVAALWRIPPPGPDNLMSDPQFICLRDTCDSLYPKGGPTGPLDFALYNALRALGLPCKVVPANARLALSPEVATARLDAAFRRKQTSHVYLCPLDQADDLPALKFGPNNIRKFATAELNALVDPLRLERVNPNWTFDAERFSEFSWLVVEESRPLEQQGARPRTFLSMTISLSEDWGRIEPHQERFPAAVEAALFAVLVAPWEDWAEFPENDWRGFRVPWVYTSSDDIFVRPSRPPSPDTLSWEPDVCFDNDGNVVFEAERPIRNGLKNTAVQASAWLDDAAWSDLTTARRSPLFDTPIAHFFVRAFLSEEPLDEFLAHIMAIEAALGHPSDYDRETRRKIAKGHSVTACMAARVSALLGAKADGEDYSRLFNLGSAYLHGRTMDAIPGKERIVARRLARRVVNALVRAALAAPALQDRKTYLDDLLIRGLG